MRKALKYVAAGMATVLLVLASVSYSVGMHQVPSASAAQADYYLKIEGIEGEIEIQSFSWGVISPRDSASGQSTGKRQYQPIIIRKLLDKTSPLLARAVGQKKYVGTVTIVKRASDGKTNEYTAVFTDVAVSAVQHDGVQGSPITETVSFTYQKIEWK